MLYFFSFWCVLPFAIQWSESAIVYILFIPSILSLSLTLPPSHLCRLSQKTRLNSLCYKAASHSIYFTRVVYTLASQVVLVVRNLPANTRDIKDTGLIPVLGRFPGGGHSNPFQYSCPENPKDRGPWHATVPRVTQSHTWLKWLNMHACSIYIC